MLEVRDIHTYYGDSYVLQGVSLKAERGSVVTVLGRNGMGKSTLCAALTGLVVLPPVASAAPKSRASLTVRFSDPE